MHDHAASKTRVREFWNRNVCQVDFLQGFEPGTREFYEASDRLRYRYHYYLPGLFDELAATHPGGRLLEIGCSMGTDLLQLSGRGFQANGIDLTEAGIELARKRFGLFGRHAKLYVGDAENLPFRDDSFDIVYSFGVLHHTPDTARAIGEVRRVLKRGGEAVIMLYNRRSLNFIAHRLLGVPFDGSKSDPVPVAFSYSADEALGLFEGFSGVSVSVEYLFGTGWGMVNRLLPERLHRFLGRHIGWHLLLRAVK